MAFAHAGSCTFAGSRREGRPARCRASHSALGGGCPPCGRGICGRRVCRAKSRVACAGMSIGEPARLRKACRSAFTRTAARCSSPAIAHRARVRGAALVVLHADGRSTADAPTADARAQRHGRLSRSLPRDPRDPDAGRGRLRPAAAASTCSIPLRVVAAVAALIGFRRVYAGVASLRWTCSWEAVARRRAGLRALDGARAGPRRRESRPPSPPRSTRSRRRSWASGSSPASSARS